MILLNYRPAKRGRAVARLLAIAGCFLAAGCAGVNSRALTSALPPGETVVSFPNSADEVWTTVLYSNPATTQAGIDGRVLAVRVFNRQQPYADELTLDFDGNLGLRGNVYTRSSRRDKKSIAAYNGDALSLVNRLRIVSYQYRNESSAANRHIGIIAEDAPPEFTSPRKDSLNLNNAIAISLAANQQLAVQVRALQTEVNRLRSELREKQR